MNLLKKVSFFFYVVILLFSWSSRSNGVVCTDVLSQKKPDIKSSYFISGAERTVTIINQDQLTQYIQKNGLQHTIDARMNRDSMPFVTNRLRNAVTNITLKGLNKIAALFTDGRVFRNIIKFENTDDGILRTSDIMRVGRELHNLGIRADQLESYEIQIGNTLFLGEDFYKLLKDSRQGQSLLKVDVDFGFYGDPLSNALSFLYQMYPRAWVAGFYGSVFVDYSQKFLDVSFSSLGVYLVASTIGTVVGTGPRNSQNKIFNMFLYLPDFDGVSKTRSFNFVRRKRAKAAIDNIELAAAKVPSWRNILIVADNNTQANIVKQELERRFNN